MSVQQTAATGRARAGRLAAVIALACGLAVLAPPSGAANTTKGWASVGCATDASGARVGDVYGPRGLIAAITNAQAGSGSTSILLAGAGCTYTLDRTDPSDSADIANGLPVITKAISICGNGSSGVAGSTITRSATAPQFRIAEVARGGSLALSCRLTISGGHAPDGTSGTTGAPATTGGPGGPGPDGGGILVDTGGSLSASNSTITNNQAGNGGTGGAGGIGGDGITSPRGGNGGTGGTGGNGGGIDNAGGTVTLSNTTVKGNAAGAGGPGGDGGAGTLPTAKGNPGPSGAPGHGGGVYDASGGTVTLRSQTTISNNNPDNCAPAGAIAGC